MLMFVNRKHVDTNQYVTTLKFMRCSAPSIKQELLIPEELIIT